MEAESVRHVLKYCSKYETEKKQIRRDLNPHIEIDDSLLADNKRIRQVLSFLAATGRFAGTRRTLEDDPPADQAPQTEDQEAHHRTRSTNQDSGPDTHDPITRLHLPS